MTRRTFLVPLFAAGLILAPSELSGQTARSPAPVAGSAAILAALSRLEAGAPSPGSSADAGRTGFYRWSVPPYS